jgi:Na+-transporting NADH:ubiquinone oxidoreductase subunit C
VADDKQTTKRSRDSVANTLVVAITLSLVASVLVASAAVLLKPIQERNEARYRQQIILEVAGLWQPGGDVDALFANIEPRMVDLASGAYTDEPDATGFDAEAAARDPELGIDIAPERDQANIRQRSKFEPVYLVRNGDRIDQVILPVYGKGLWSTLRGFLALDPDGNTVRGLQFYEHAETPGLGDQIDKPEWQAQWPGKKLFGAGEEPVIEVARGKADPASPQFAHEVDGLSGATLTGRGVTNLLRYWTGPDGFGPYLARLRSEANDDD